MQLHRKESSTSGWTFGLAPRSATACKDVTVNSNEALLAVSAQPPVSVAIEANSVFFQLFLAVSCSSGAARTSTSLFFPSVIALTQHGLRDQFRNPSRSSKPSLKTSWAVSWRWCSTISTLRQSLQHPSGRYTSRRSRMRPERQSQ